MRDSSVRLMESAGKAIRTGSSPTMASTTFGMVTTSGAQNFCVCIVSAEAAQSVP